MLAFDRVAGIIPLHVTDTGESALIVRGEAMVAVLVLSFEQLWVHAQPFQHRNAPAVSGAAGIGLSESDRSLLRLLGMGVKDEAAARHLGVSVRTVRRQIADIMRTLDAESRFQAGIEAANRGWL
jgi:DNA-binding NarL/FixJ family response regulator